MAVFTTGSAPELLYPGLAGIFGDSYTEFPTAYDQIFMIETSDKAFEKVQGMSGLSASAIKSQGNEVAYQRPYQTFQAEYTHVTYGTGVIVTREMLEDEQYGYINKLPKFLARSVRETQEIVAANVLNRGFTAGFTGADGQTLFSASHPLAVDGDDLSNTASVALTETALENALIAIRGWRSDNNLRANIQMKKLVVPSALYIKARKILGTQYKTGSADNDINVIAGLNLEIVDNTYLTSNTAWFLTTDVMDGLTYFERRPVEIQRDNDFDTENLKMKTTTRFSVGWTNWRGAYGSTGA